MNVLSLFDGSSCCQIALNKFGIHYDNYFASEIDKYALAISKANYPKSIYVGDVLNVKGKQLPNIDLLAGGSPCQGFSFAGKTLNFDDPRSKLFFEFVRILDETKPKYFFFENVPMSTQSKNIISSYLGVEPILINSNLVSAQNRKRYYWTNIGIPKIEDKNIFWSDIMEHEAEDVTYYSEAAFKWIFKTQKRRDRFKEFDKDSKIKMQLVEASHHKLYSNQRCFGITDKKGMRYISPLECERLQNMPDNYTNHVSRSRRYMAIGNGWTVDVVGEFFKLLEF
jgi:DNA-cytosine methyltransferase